MRVTLRDHWSQWLENMVARVEEIERTTEAGTPARLEALKKGQAYASLLRRSLDGQVYFSGHPGARKRRRQARQRPTDVSDA